ncbi:MAG: hypothetical protein NXI20_25400 [bacterium]|nr:hypothetical protein [bacterium]
MSTHQLHLSKSETYFVTFTCHNWFHLFETTNCYNYFDKWFNYLIKNKVSLLAYVIMPNHFHGLLHLHEGCPKNLNQLVGNGKRFLAYEIIKRLKSSKQTAILETLENDVDRNERKKGKLHQVFQLSFDAKQCYSRNMVETKLDYIHRNPTSGNWKLADDWSQYTHSSAGFYEFDVPILYITHYKEIWD